MGLFLVANILIDACDHLTAEDFACGVSNIRKISIGCCRDENFEHIKN